MAAGNSNTVSSFSDEISVTTLEKPNSGENQFDSVIYSENFDSDPSFTSYSETHAYWDSSAGNYYVKTRDNLDSKYWAHSSDLGNINPTVQNINLSFDIMIENQDWGTYPNIGFYSDIPTEINDPSRVFFMHNANADNSRERFGTCTYAVSPAKCIRSAQWSVDNNVWYRVKYEVRNTGTTVNWTVTEISTGKVIANFQNEDFPITSFNYIGVGYYGSVDYGSTWAPMRIDNISISEHVASKAQITENFNDNDYLTNPTWTLQNTTIVPGTVNVINGEAQIVRSGAGGSGGTVGISMNVDIEVTDSTVLSFDAKPVSRSVRRGCGDSCTEHPVNIQLYLEDAQQNELILRYSVNYGGAIEDVSTSTFKQISFNVTQNTWLLDINNNISNAWPQAVKIKRIFVFGAGWSFEGHIDNILIK